LVTATELAKYCQIEVKRMKTNRIFVTSVLATLAVYLTGCGGGNGGGEPEPLATAPITTVTQTVTPKAPPAELREEVVPMGSRIDLRSQNYFPYADGDRWTFYKLGASGELIGYETFATSDPPVTSTIPAKASSIVFPLNEYLQPFYPVGSIRISRRAGGWGEDVDGDGAEDGFKFEYSQIFRGTETLIISGKTLTVAHFSNTTTWRIIPSDSDFVDGISSFVEEAYFAPNFGLVKSSQQLLDGNGLPLEPVFTLLLDTATVSGKDWLESLLDGSRIPVELSHRAIVFDPLRNVYYASTPSSATLSSRIATIQSATGSVTYSAPFSDELGALAISLDGQYLYAGLDATGELVKLQLPTFAIAARANIGSTRIVSIAISPTDPEQIAVSRDSTCRGCSGGYAGIALLKSMVLQPQATDSANWATAITFSPDGATLYSLDTASSGAYFFSHKVLADGLVTERLIAKDGVYRAHQIWFDEGQFVLGNSVMNLPALDLVATVPGNVYQCSPMPPGRLICNTTTSGPVSYGTTPGYLELVDRATGSLLASPRYSPYANNTVSQQLLTAGPPGQVAISDRLNGYDTVFSRLWLFQSALLQ
jgi:hypothetical protein